MKAKNILVLFSMALAVLSGCGRQTTPDSLSIDKAAHAATLLASAQIPARPTFLDVAIPPKPAVDEHFLAEGKRLYAQNCAACHGDEGDGRGDAAAFLAPRPRDFEQAKYRLRSTGPGQLPTDTDLFRSVSFGMPGTPMPPWRHLLSDQERWAVVEYIKTFSERFSDPSENRPSVVSLGSPTPKTATAIAEGQALYVQMGCISCHGDSGRGNGLAAGTLTDDSGARIKPRDLTNAKGFKSGYAAREIVRAVLTGFEGTPMIGYADALKPEQAWSLAYYLESLARPVEMAPVQTPSQNFLVREQLGEPDVRIQLTERAWQFDPSEIRVQKGQIVEVTFEPTDNGLGVGHGFAISGYDEVAFMNGAMVGAPKTVRFRADRVGKFTYYCSTQCSTEKLHPLMNGTFYVEPAGAQTASLK